MLPTDRQVMAFIMAVAPSMNLNPKTVCSQCFAESSFDQSKIGNAGEIGLMQLMPTTAEELHLDPNDWRLNLLAGMIYLARQIHYFGAEDKGLAAYNCGPGTLRSVLEYHSEDWIEFVPLSTKKYVNSILGRD